MLEGFFSLGGLCSHFATSVSPTEVSSESCIYVQALRRCHMTVIIMRTPSSKHGTTCNLNELFLQKCAQKILQALFNHLKHLMPLFLDLHKLKFAFR